MAFASGKRYRTVDLARAAGTHENTVRMYAEWGFLAKPERAQSGYRLWKGEDIDQMKFARFALHGMWPGHRIRVSALALVRRAATGDLTGALADARAHASLVADERRKAEDAAAFLERWAQTGTPRGRGDGRYGPAEAAAMVPATAGQIRNWERNRLIDTPRDPDSGHRVYGNDEIGRLRVIRSLILAGYSVSAILRMATELDRGKRRALAEILDTPRDDEDALTAFDRWLHSLGEQASRAEKLIAMLEERISRAASGNPDPAP